jgi:urease accessory protein
MDMDMDMGTTRTRTMATKTTRAMPTDRQPEPQTMTMDPMTVDEGSPRTFEGCCLRPHDGVAGRGTAPLARLLMWLSPAYPVGAFSYSHGLEWVIDRGEVHDSSTLLGWIEDVLIYGAGHSDIIFLAESWRALASADACALERVAELAAAYAPSAERRLETLAQGTAFLAATRAGWPKPELEALAADGRQVAYPVAVGASAAAHGLPLSETASAYAQAWVASLVSAAVRLIPMGQSDGLRTLARLEPIVPRVVEAALAATLEEVGGAALAADIASMRHETQYTRLFRS